MKFAMKCSILATLFCVSIFPKEQPFPIQFSIPEKKVVKGIPRKERDFAFIVPRELNTYIYTVESDYYADYQRSYFAITCAKGGWDCMRHYEILANGCIPYFVDLDKCNPMTMTLLPKELIWEAMHLEGVSFRKIDHKKFNKKRYYEILEQLLEYTKKHLTTRAMAQHILDMVHYAGTGKILYLSHDPGPDYLRCCVLIGLKEIFGASVVDYPKIDHIYTSYPIENLKSIYGKGFSYTRIVEDLQVDRENIEQRIKDKEFDLIIYGSVHRGLRLHKLVQETYPQDKILYICGEDSHKCDSTHLHNLFLREFDAL